VVVVVTAIIIVKLGFRNADTVIEQATAFTLDEEVYVPFKLGELDLKINDKTAVPYPIKTSHANWKLQSFNLIATREQLEQYFSTSGWTCLHLRNFGIEYDITVMDNVTIVNPAIVQESKQKRNIKEIDINGETTHAKRPVWIEIDFYNEKLQRNVVKLYNDQAACFLHYN
jgi:hypothetical protein